MSKTVQNLIDELQELIKMHPAVADCQVKIAIDEEGNGYSDFYEATYTEFDDDGEPVCLEADQSVDDLKPNVVVLWP